VACAPHSKTIAKRHMGLGFLSSQSSINLFFVTVHPALYEDLIPYVHVAHDLESLVRSTVCDKSENSLISCLCNTIDVINT
jgi:hypothetical protein